MTATATLTADTDSCAGTVTAPNSGQITTQGQTAAMILKIQTKGKVIILSYVTMVTSYIIFLLGVSGNKNENNGGGEDVVGILGGFLGEVKPFECQNDNQS